MKHYSLLSDEQRTFFDHLTALPRKILQHYEVGELPQIVLHQLCHPQCFSLKKAAFFIDNPDFDRFVGLAGFSHDECQYHQDDVWASPEQFQQDMKSASFNNEVKNLFYGSLSCSGDELAHSKAVKEACSSLDIQNPNVFTWNMKHGNHGILVFETEEEVTEDTQKMLGEAASLLSFCPL